MKHFPLISPRNVLASVAIALSLGLGLTAPLQAQLSGRVNFERGSDMAALNGTITGREYRDFVLRARKGQTLMVSLADDGTGNPEDKHSVFFNILPPGSNNVAIYNSSAQGPNAMAKIKLPKDGDYTIRVYLMGEAKDGNHTVPFTFSVTIR
ncbi:MULTISPECIES: hypothetical protein [Microcystis]|jgi:hypothetical protein|uniref:Gifsy-1 prophage protein n=3 Tax=Microcystis TaxID=1125 RepID=A0A841UXW8_MICAE|nr:MULTISPECIES: hypothetical protein [Microcystis]AKV69867.1 putative Gifsy-1 prophage protein [Microcystis panniformis FACHB-1757]MBC1193600.1 hypothetical protein [Microcystis aeruginosa BLCC-F108]MBD2623497.1 hypothetical protein [Microcystis flos-aquae FACHB-1344]MBE9073738.1 hypothetical protein [Microcystis sp. LEGE 08355]MCA2591959.1 hypothetical protein [Microcystis sp. M31BS1]